MVGKKEEILIFTQILGECRMCEKSHYTYKVLRLTAIFLKIKKNVSFKLLQLFKFKNTLRHFLCCSMGLNLIWKLKFTSESSLGGYVILKSLL